MKTLKKSKLTKGLKKLQSKYGRKFSKKERRVISSAIKRIEKRKSTGKWLKKAGEILKSIVTIILEIF